MSIAAPPRPTNVVDLPDEKFWQRYSPHHEFSLSSVSSFALHLLILGLAAFACMIPFFNRNDAPMPLTAVMLGDNGGQPDGDERSRGQNADSDGQPIPPDEKPAPLPQVPNVELPKDARPNLTPIPEVQEPSPQRTIEAIADFFAQECRRAKDSNKTRGPDNKPAKGEGSGDPGGKVENVHIRRMLRWTMNFNTRDGKDYVKQLQSLGAIVAFEVPDDATKLTFYRDLTSPAKGEVEEVKGVKNIWWIDDKPESVSALCDALKIKPAPKRLIAFLPTDLEEKLLKLELKYAKGKTEDEIEETVFEVKNRGEERYEPVVIRQRHK